VYFAGNTGVDPFIWGGRPLFFFIKLEIDRASIELVIFILAQHLD
jgi:hypothetical protein